MQKTKIEPLGIEVRFFTDKNKYQKHLTKHLDYQDVDLSGLDGRCLYLENANHEKVIYIGVFNSDTVTLAHECNHAILFMFQEFGLNPMDSMGEHFCYMHGKLMRDCIEWLN